MGRIIMALALALLPLTAFAAEKIKGANYMVVDAQSWETSETSGYWMINARGVSSYLEGPFEAGAVECHGAGYWDAEGSWGEGICVHSEGDDTRTSSWIRGKGEELGRWEMLGGTGKYAGISGSGTYKPNNLPDGRLISEFEGEVTLAE